MVFMETELASLNADLGRLAYLTNPKVRGLFKTTLMSAGVGGYVWQNNEVNGFPAYASNFVPSNLTKGSASENVRLSYSVTGTTYRSLAGAVWISLLTHIHWLTKELSV